MTRFVFRHKFLLAYVAISTATVTLGLWIALAAVVVGTSAFSLFFTHRGGR